MGIITIVMARHKYIILYTFVNYNKWYIIGKKFFVYMNNWNIYRFIQIHHSIQIFLSFTVYILIQYLYQMKRSFVYRYVYFSVTTTCFRLLKKSRSFISVRAFLSWDETSRRNVEILVCLSNKYRCVYMYISVCICMCE